MSTSPPHAEGNGADAPIWALATGRAFDAVRSRAAGLSADEARRRLDAHGPNRLPEGEARSPWALFFAQFRGFLNLLLLGAAVLAFVIGDTKDAVVVTAVVVFNAVLGFVQEHRAEAAVASLRRMLTRTAKVRREGREAVVDADTVVPGDLVLLEAGDRVPADGRLVLARALEVDESSLTGESTPTAKHTEAIGEPELPIGDRANLAFMNTVVTRGRGELLVTGTGAATEMGRLAAMLESAEPSKTPLQLQIDGLGRRLALIAGAAVVVITALQLARGVPWVELVMEAVAIAVAAIPEGLPAVVTVTLAIGMRRMAKSRAIVKRMSSVETLGCTTDICSDKTGTLTLNQMTAEEVALRDGTVAVTGRGYGLDGTLEGERTSALASLLRTAALCNDSAVREGEVIGDPTEGALVVLAAKGGVDVETLRREEPRVAEVPFEAERKLSATVHAASEGDGADGVMLVKGAPDVLFERCEAVLGTAGPRPLDAGERAWLDATNQRMAERGLRVLALAQRSVALDDLPRDPDALAARVEGLTLLGLIGLLDPPRAEVRDAIATCRSAGIAVRMITGDHPATGLAIARALGLRGDVLSGRQLDPMDDEELARRMPSVGVLARVSPEHKLRAVDALRRGRRVVAMIGDGVNDAPALKRADIGVAMGITGTEVTKEAATLILSDDDFGTIVGAIHEGRTIYDNIVRFLRFQLSTNLGALATIFLAPLFGLPVPFTPLQILWVNLIMDGPPAMALGVDPADRHIMRMPPRDPDVRILTMPRLAVLSFFGAIMAAGTIGMLVYGLSTRDAATGTTLAFTTFVLFQVFNIFNARFERRSAFGRHALRNRWLWLSLAAVVALQVAVVYVPPLQSLLDTAALAPEGWLLAAGVASSVLVLDELRKLVMRRVHRAREGGDAGSRRRPSPRPAEERAPPGDRGSPAPSA
jgi:Ca2+-transporting ATPase